MTPEVQIKLLETLREIIPPILTFFGGLLLPQLKVGKK